MSKAGVLIWRYIFESGDKKRIASQHPDLSGITIQKDIPYIDDGERGHLFDIYRRKDADAGAPVMINIHGGGLFASYKEVNAHFNYEMAKLGYTVVSLSYRRIPETTLWHQIDDVLCAFRYLEAHAEELGLNTDQIYLSGDSAGALLSLFVMALHSSEKLQKDFGIAASGLKIRAAGLISIMLDTQRKDMLRTLSNTVTDKKDRNRPYEKYLLNPSLLLDESDIPPVILFTSDEDLIQKDTLKLKGILAEKNLAFAFHNWPKGTDYQLVHVFAVSFPYYEESRELMRMMDEWYGEH